CLLPTGRKGSAVQLQHRRPQVFERLFVAIRFEELRQLLAALNVAPRTVKQPMNDGPQGAALGPQLSAEASHHRGLGFPRGNPQRLTDMGEQTTRTTVARKKVADSATIRDGAIEDFGKTRIRRPRRYQADMV